MPHRKMHRASETMKLLPDLDRIVVIVAEERIAGLMEGRVIDADPQAAGEQRRVEAARRFAAADQVDDHFQKSCANATVTPPRRAATNSISRRSAG